MVKISLPRKTAKQLWLFDVDQYVSTLLATGEVNHGRVRTAIGDYYEHRTALLLGGVVHQTDSRCDYCPDVSARGRYFEVKAVGNSGQAFIYAGRLVKDCEFALTNKLYYVFWRHSVETRLVNNVADLKAKLAANTTGCMIVPFAAVDDVCKLIEPTKLNSKYGGSDTNPRYGSGYRIPITKFAKWSVHYEQ